VTQGKKKSSAGRLQKKGFKRKGRNTTKKGKRGTLRKRGKRRMEDERLISTGLLLVLRYQKGKNVAIVGGEDVQEGGYMGKEN